MTVNPGALRLRFNISLMAAGALLIPLPLTSTFGYDSQYQKSARLTSFPNPRQATIRVNSGLVQVDAIVTDTNGARISNLNINNFVLSEDNHRQKLVAVDFFDVSRSQTPQASEPIYVSLANSDDSQKLRAIGHDHRLLVLFFDLTSFGKGYYLANLLRSVASAHKFVKEQMTPADLLCIIAFSKQLVVKAEFTNDQAMLLQALDSLIPGKDVGTVNNTQNASTDGSLEAAEGLSELLARIPGRKSVIHFTAGFAPTDPTTGNPQLEKTTGMANTANVSFYEIDSRGLDTGADDASVGFGGRGTRPGTPRLLTHQSDGTREILDTLAHDTGGALFVDMNDFTSFFKQIQEDSTGYYLLSYESSNTVNDGRYRNISLKLSAVPTGNVKYRPGYYAPSKK
jgi:VWFA-related protein